MRRTLPIALVLSAVLAASVAVAATPPPGAKFETDTYYAGPRIWVGNLNGATAIGAQIEKGFTKPGDYGPGIIAGGLGIDYYSWSNSFPPFGEYKYSVIPIEVFGNYHFVLPDNPQIDPYAGLALVYSHVSASWEGNGLAFGSASGSSTDFAGIVGGRYFFSEKFAVQAQIGFGYGTLGLGATWRF
jgi:hypothetical protein